jgi:hypothetical protein
MRLHQPPRNDVILEMKKRAKTWESAKLVLVALAVL